MLLFQRHARNNFVSEPTIFYNCSKSENPHNLSKVNGQNETTRKSDTDLQNPTDSSHFNKVAHLTEQLTELEKRAPTVLNQHATQH